MFRRSQRALAAHDVGPATPLEASIRVPGLRLARRCLSCLAMFDSAWAGERICTHCKGTARWRSGSGDGPA